MRIGLFAGIALMAMSAPALAQETVSGYQRRDGTYVQPYHRTEPNSTRMDNYSTRPNVNPYTGQTGTENPNPPPPTYHPYVAQHKICTYGTTC